MLWTRRVLAVCIMMLTVVALFIHNNTGTESSQNTWGLATIMTASMATLFTLSDTYSKLKSGSLQPDEEMAQKILAAYSLTSVALLCMAVYLSMQNNSDAVMYILAFGLLVYGIGSNMLVTYCEPYKRQE